MIVQRLAHLICKFLFSGNIIIDIIIQNGYHLGYGFLGKLTCYCCLVNHHIDIFSIILDDIHTTVAIYFNNFSKFLDFKFNIFQICLNNVFKTVNIKKINHKNKSVRKHSCKNAIRHNNVMNPVRYRFKYSITLVTSIIIINRFKITYVYHTDNIINVLIFKHYFGIINKPCKITVP